MYASDRQRRKKMQIFLPSAPEVIKTPCLQALKHFLEIQDSLEPENMQAPKTYEYLGEKTDDAVLTCRVHKA